MAEAQLKGSAYLSTLAFIESNFGAGAKERVLSRLSAEDRGTLGQSPLAIQWYPLGPFPRLLRAMDEELGRGDLALITTRGTWAAVQDMKTVHRVLLKLVTPQWVIDKGMKLWPNFHSTGHWEPDAKATRERGPRCTSSASSTKRCARRSRDGSSACCSWPGSRPPPSTTAIAVRAARPAACFR